MRPGWLLALIICGATLLGSAPAGAQEAQPPGRVGRVVAHLAAVHSGPGAEFPLVWRLYEGSQVAVVDEAIGSNGGPWRKIRLWNTQDGWLEAAAVSFQQYPPPRRGGSGWVGPCAEKPPPGPPIPRPLHAPARAVAPTTLLEGPNGGAPLAEVAPSASGVAEAWAVGSDGRAHYRFRPEGTPAAGWAAPGAVALQAADPATRQVGGRSIVEPLRGVGMWFILDSREPGVDGGARVAAAARDNGLTHLYVEVANSSGGFYARRWLDELLPATRAAGVAVIGSHFACLDDLSTDLDLALEIAGYRAPTGEALDGLTVDLEMTLVPENLQAYGELLRHQLGDDYLLVATTYPPESYAAPRYPWPALAASWNAIVPMAYWRQMEERPFRPDEVSTYTRRNIDKLRALTGRPDLQVEMLGQLFEMGRPLLLGPDPPTAGEVLAAAEAAREAGAVGISYFDWTRATPAHWAALAGFRW